MRQLALFDTRDWTDLTNYPFPDYIKVYSIYAYDHDKYIEEYAKLRKKAIKHKDLSIFYGISPYEVIKKCLYFYDDGSKQFLNDEKHIYRFKTLQKIYETICKIILKKEKLSLFDNARLEYCGVRIDYDVYLDEIYEYKTAREGIKKFKGQRFDVLTAELIGSENLSIYQKLKIHISLLRYLRQENLETAVEKVKKEYREWLMKN
jgi:hypothetical protein